METLDVFVKTAASYLAETLVGHGEWERIEQIARLLPAAAISIFGFECHLNPNPHADFFACIAATGTDREILAGRDPARALPAELMEQSIWIRVRDFSRIWTTPMSPLYGGVKNIWLEFDVEHGSEQVPLPSVFVGLGRSLEASGGRISEDMHRWLPDIALPLLLGSRVQSETVDTLRDCFAALPIGAQVTYVGLMLPRGLDTLRICLIGLTPDQISGYLRRVGWLGSFGELEAIISTISKIAHLDMLQIEVGQTVYARIGLECTIPLLPVPSLVVPHWKRFLDQLVDIGLCPAEQCDALLVWPGFAPVVIGDMPWTTGPRQASGRRCLTPWGTLIRYIAHVKISVQADKALEAKAYLMCRWRSMMSPWN